MREDIAYHLGVGLEERPRYRIYSAHDSNIASWMDVLAPFLNWGNIALSQSIHIELWDVNDDPYVRMAVNGTYVPLSKCGDRDYCSSKEFQDQLNWRLFVGPIDVACKATYDPEE